MLSPSTSSTLLSLPSPKQLVAGDFNLDELVGILTRALVDESQRNEILELTGDNAVLVVECLDKVISSDVVKTSSDIPTRSTVLSAISRLSRGSQHLPHSYWIDPNTITVPSEPHAFGKCAQVYRGTRNGESVAVKVLRTSKQESQTRLRDRYCKEVIVWKHVSCPHILKFNGTFYHNGVPAIVTPWMPHGNITEYLEENTGADRLRLILDVFRGTEYLHSYDIAHGDIKTPNILISNSTPPRAMLSDFGSSRITTTTAEMSGEEQGAPSFMAPELLLPTKFGLENGAPSKEADIYALGITAYQVLTGKRPFLPRRNAGIMRAVISGERPAKPENAEGIGMTEAVWDFLRECWREDRTARPNILDALRKLCDITGVDEGSFTVRSTAAPPVKILVMGAFGSGKSTFINHASGSNIQVGMGLESCTAEVRVADEFTLDGRMVTLFDTPGFDGTTQSDTDILKMIAFFLAARYEEGSTLAGVIYIHRISDIRFGGITGRNFNMFRKLCGESTLKNVILVTNMWGEIPQDTGEAREKELSNKFFKSTLDKGARMLRHHNTAESAHTIIRGMMKNQPVGLQIQRELVDDHKNIIDTAAGESLNQEFNELIERHRAELKKLREETAQALEAKDEEMKREIEETKKSLEEKIKKIKEEIPKMATNYAEEKQRMAAKMKRLQDRITIPIYRASNDDDQIASTRVYKSTDRVLNLRKELMRAAAPRNLFVGHVYVEVVLRGQKEGKFLDDPEAHRDKMAGHVSRLVYWTSTDIDREVRRITMVSPSALSKVITGAASLVGRNTHYQYILSARSARDVLHVRDL